MSNISETLKFIGRRNEVNELAVHLEKSAAGSGQLVFISGEAGIGKTKFINEIASLPIGQRFNWLSTRCIYSEGTDPYLPITDALKGWLGPKLGSGSELDVKFSGLKLKDSQDQEYNLNELAKIPLIGPKLIEEPDMSFGTFLVKEPKSEFCLKVFSTIVATGRNGLCISRVPPDQLNELSANQNTKVFWLSSKPGEQSLPPSLTKLSHEINQFISSNPNSFILIDGLEYLISHLEFNKVLRFVNELVDSMAVRKSILLMPINPLTIDPKQLALLERNMNTLDMTDPSSIMPESMPTEPEVSDSSNAGSGIIDEQKFNEEKIHQGRNIMFESTTQQLISISRTKPVVLFIDDLHWADAGALHLIHYLGRAVRNHPVAIIGAYRSEDLTDLESTHPLQALLDRLIPEKLVKIINLDRFDQLETGEIIQSLLHTTKYPKELDGYIYSETEGNPLFIEEVVRSLEEEKVIRFNDNMDTWILTRKIPEIELPDTIKEVVQSRINRLDKNKRVLLEIASVLGVEFEYNVLAAISKLDEDQLVTDLDDLMRYQLLIEQPTTFGQSITYRFVHNKICEVLYTGLSQSRKRLLHSKTVSVIEDLHQTDLDKFIYDLAHHCYHGGDHKRSQKYTVQAGEKAMQGFAPEKARTFYQWALDSIELEEARETPSGANKILHAEVLVKLAETCSLIGEWDCALNCTNRLFDIGDNLGDQRKLVDGNIYAGRIYLNRSEWTEANNYFTKALKLAKELNYQQGMMEAYKSLGEVHDRKDEYSQAIDYYNNFMKIAESIHSKNEIARGYKSFAGIFHNRGEFNTALDYYQKCIELLTSTNNISELAKAYTNMGITYFELDEFDKVIEYNNKCIEITKRIGDIRVMGYGYSNAAEAYARLNDFENAMDYANKAFEIFSKLDEKFMIGLVWMNYGIIYKNKKEWDSSRYYFEKSLAMLRELDMPYHLADCTHQFAMMLRAQGSVEALKESRENLERALNIFKDLGSKKFITEVQNELNELAK
jgi:predicted ATPase